MDLIPDTRQTKYLVHNTQYTTPDIPGRAGILSCTVHVIILWLQNKLKYVYIDIYTGSGSTMDHMHARHTPCMHDEAYGAAF